MAINQYVAGGIVGLALALILHMRGQAYAYAVTQKKKKKTTPHPHHRHIRTPAQQQHIRSVRRHASSHPKDTRLIHGTSATHIGDQRIEGDIDRLHAVGGGHPVNDPMVIKPSKNFRGGGTRIWGDLTASETEPHFM